MEHTKLVTPDELENFADRRDSESVVPELVFMLINLSVPDLSVCRIPYGDSIGLPGLDGFVQSGAGFRQFVPPQTSYWEIGRSEKAQDKATEDYRKRTDSTSSDERAKASFVFVTPRSKDWDQASQTKWIERRKNDGWKEIKVLDGVQICDWLREFPVVGRWLLKRIGLVRATSGFQTPVEHWAHISQMTAEGDPPLPSQIFLVGREAACKQLERLFRRETQQLVLTIESEHDAEDFVAAFLQSLDETARNAHGSRCLFVSDPDAWQTFSSLRAPHILVASPRLDLADSNEQLHMAAKGRGHGIVIPVSGASSQGSNVLVPIRSPSRSALEGAFIEAGYSRDRAALLAGAGAQSLASLKRHLRGLGDRPPYASWDAARTLGQAALVGKWRGGNEADREAIEILLGKSYGEWIEDARAATLRPDTPLIQRNEAWKIISREEAWIALGPRITDQDLERFQKLAIRVLSEKDPVFELAKEERYAASVHGKVKKHSRSIREGIAESLALLGAKGDALTSTSHGRAGASARIVVHSILNNADWITWASLSGELPLLAEAAPEDFLDAVETALADASSSPFLKVFEQEGGGFGGWNYITGVLWALETLAWNPDYLGRVTTLLGDLASLDPGGNWANRPKNSLVDIFLPWLSHTLAELPQRAAALEALLREQPKVGWNLLLSLLPSSRGTTSGTRKPVWRPYIPQGWTESVTKKQYWEQVQHYAELCTRIAATDLLKLAELVDRLPDLPEPAYSQVLSHLTSQEVLSLSEEDRLPLWEALMDLITKHRRYPNANWVMQSDQLAKLNDVTELLAPKSVELVNRRLFSERDFDLYEQGEKFEVQQQRLDKRRQDALSALLSAYGLERVIEFAWKVDSPGKVGNALGALGNNEFDSYLFPGFLLKDEKACKQFIGSYIWRRFWDSKWNWVDRQLRLEWKSSERLAYLLCLPSEPDVWRRAERCLGAEVEKYWSQVTVNPWGLEKDALLEAAEKLTAHGQSGSAVDCLYLLAQKKIPIPIALATSVLLTVVASEVQQKRIDQHHVIEVIDWLQENEPAESEALFQIEWSYLPVLNRVYGGEPKVLERRLATSAKFFGEIVAAVFRSDKEDKTSPKEVNEREASIARNAYSLLHGWRILPGLRPDGSFDGDEFAVWLQEAKAVTKESGHFDIAMDQLGQALAYAPADPNGLWIHMSIAKALDAKDVPTMRKALRTGLFNKRGVYGFSRGEAERKIAEEYRQKANALAENGFHRVADVIRGLAEDYERDADRESQRDIFDEH